MKTAITLLFLALFLSANSQVCFNTATNFPLGGSPYIVISADFNGDGIIDLTTDNIDSHDVSVLSGDDTGTFGEAVHFAVGLSPQSITSADFNGDGKIDLGTANSGTNNDISILLGKGTGSSTNK